MYTGNFSVERPLLTRWSTNIEHATVFDLTSALLKRLGDLAEGLTVKKGLGENLFLIVAGPTEVGNIRLIKHADPPAAPKKAPKRKTRRPVKPRPTSKKHAP